MVWSIVYTFHADNLGRKKNRYSAILIVSNHVMLELYKVLENVFLDFPKKERILIKGRNK